MSSKFEEQLDHYLSLMEKEVVVEYGGPEAGDVWRAVSDKTDKVLLRRSYSMEDGRYRLILENGHPSGVEFLGEPGGHEMSSMILTLLHHSGRAPAVGEEVISRIMSIEEDTVIETFYSVECNNCPDVVQTFNLMSFLNPRIKHVAINGSHPAARAEERGVLSVPAVFRDGVLFHSGRATVEELLDKFGSTGTRENIECDMVIVGGGPAGVSAALYSARKGLDTVIVCEKWGGQVASTDKIENVAGVLGTTGNAMSSEMKSQTSRYGVKIVFGKAEDIAALHDGVVLRHSGGSVRAKTAVLAPGATWRKLGVPGEEDFLNRGVTFCPHCDGPLFEGKDVVVVGGGNSGVEAALDLSGIARHVTLVEYAEELGADSVLVEEAVLRRNVDIITGHRVTKISGSNRVTGVEIQQVSGGATRELATDGVFVQAGLVPNTAWLPETLKRNEKGEIVTDGSGLTSLNRVFAAGDATDTRYKQISVAVGSGASAALRAFESVHLHE